ncbi:zinc finger protein 135-like isoform X4 [Dicentrarchus labrax]|uniref:zinc finger protein 135-like isoform X4 n=1 Tax=Dicentrarchus labrax TaxID=13489 RepID=UPI0021F692CC|nr:zinc finger protein 135-like isoform X4 [Dicentrarchus labrax]
MNQLIHWHCLLWILTVQQQQDPEHLHIKEEQEGLRSSQEGEKLHGPVPVKSEDDEEKAPSSQLHQRQTDNQMKAVVNGEDCEGPEPARKLRVLVKQRLTAVVEEIFGLFETTLVEYEEEIESLHKLLEEAVKLQMNTAADVPQLMVIKEEVPSEQQERRTNLDQDDKEEFPHIKDEQEVVWSSQEGENIQGLEEDDLTKFTFTAVSVKSEDDEEKAQFSQLHQTQTDEQMKAVSDGEDCGGSESARILGPACDSQQEMSLLQSGLVTLNYNEDSVSHKDSNPVEKLCVGQTFSIPNIRVDTGGKPFSCTICGKGFREKSDLKRHIRFHTGEKPFSCVFCVKNFTEKADLKRHMRVHTGEKPFSCPICGKSFGEKNDLTRHIRVHTGEKPFSCSICGKIFSQNENLRRHERIHTGEKPFTCPVCTKPFTHRGALVVHMRIHTGEKPFGCSVCGKRYIETGNLKKHMRVHTGEKPFSCSVCGRRFNYQSQVKNHKCSGESSVTIAHNA